MKKAYQLILVLSIIPLFFACKKEDDKEEEEVAVVKEYFIRGRRNGVPFEVYQGDGNTIATHGGQGIETDTTCNYNYVGSIINPLNSANANMSFEFANHLMLEECGDHAEFLDSWVVNAEIPFTNSDDTLGVVMLANFGNGFLDLWTSVIEEQGNSKLKITSKEVLPDLAGGFKRVKISGTFSCNLGGIGANNSDEVINITDGEFAILLSSENGQ